MRTSLFERFIRNISILTILSSLPMITTGCLEVVSVKGRAGTERLLNAGKKKVAPDQVAPQLSIRSPQEGALVPESSLSVLIYATDDRGLKEITLKYDDEVMATYEVQADEKLEILRNFNLNVTQIGNHDIEVSAVDESGNRSQITTSIRKPDGLALGPFETTLTLANKVTFKASGGVPPYKFAFNAQGGGQGSLDVKADDTVEYTPPSSLPAKSDITVKVTDGRGQIKTAVAHLKDRIKLSGAKDARSLLKNQTLDLSTAGGVPPYMISIADDSQLKAADGIKIENLSQNAGTARLRVGGAVGKAKIVVTDRLMNSSTLEVSVVDNLGLQPSVNVTELGRGVKFVASGGLPPYAFSKVSGEGSINGSGDYSTPSSLPDSNTVRIRVTDADGRTAEASITLKDRAQLVVATRTAAVGDVVAFKIRHDSGVPFFVFERDPTSSAAGTFDSQDGTNGTGLVRLTSVGAFKLKVTDGLNSSDTETINVVDSLDVDGVQYQYYVNGEIGNDSWAGTIGQPFKTLGKAQSQVRLKNDNMQGDVVVNIRAGRCELSSTLNLDSNDSASNGHKIIWQAYPGEKPVLSGGKVISGWTDMGNGVFKASVPSGLKFRQLYVKSKRAVRARSPNLGQNFRLRSWAFSRSRSGSNQVISDAKVVVCDPAENTATVPLCNDTNKKVITALQGAYPSSQINGKGVEMVVVKHFGFDRLRIESYTDAVGFQPARTIQFSSTERYRAFALDNPSLDSNQSFWLENAKAFLDAPGEWYLETSSNTLYYMPRSGENLAFDEVVAPSLQTLVAVRGSKGVEFHNLRFEHSNWTAPDSGGFVGVQGGAYSVDTISGNSVTVSPENRDFPEGAVYVEYATSVRFAGNVFQHLGGIGLDLAKGVKQSSVDNNAFYDIAGNGLNIGSQAGSTSSTSAQQVEARNNYFKQIGQDYANSVGIYAGQNDQLTLDHNEFVNLPASAITVGWPSGAAHPTNSVVSANRVSAAVDTLEALGAIQVAGAVSGTQVIDNHVKDLLASEASKIVPSGNNFASSVGVFGFFLDANTRGLTMSSNVVDNSPQPSLYKVNCGADCDTQNTLSGALAGGGDVSRVRNAAGIEANVRGIIGQVDP